MPAQIDSASWGTEIGDPSLRFPSPVYPSLSRKLLVKLVSLHPTHEDSDVARITHGLVRWLSRLASIKKDGLGLLCASEEFRIYCCESLSVFGFHEPSLQHILIRDQSPIAELLQRVLMSVTLVEDVLNLDDDHAAKFLIILQRALDNTSGSPGSPFNERSRQTAYRTIIRLSQRCQKLPPSLFIEGTSLTSGLIIGGGFADIYEGRYRGQTVAIKRMRMLHGGAAEIVRVRNVLFREALVWQRLKDPCILPFIGIDADLFAGQFCLISPWMPNGCILTYPEKNRPLTIDIESLLTGIGHGLVYLHSENVIHGDLRGANVFMDNHGCPLLADFGLAYYADATRTSTTSGSVRWMAPELLLPDKFGLNFQRTYATDVYAFGCVCLEVYTRRHPFPEIKTDPELIIKINNSSLRPTRPSVGECQGVEIADEWWALILSCLKEDSSERPHEIQLRGFFSTQKYKRRFSAVTSRGVLETDHSKDIQDPPLAHASSQEYHITPGEGLTLGDEWLNARRSESLSPSVYYSAIGSRAAEQEANILRLTEDSDTFSVPSPLSSCSDDSIHGSVHTLSYVRDQEPEYTVRANSGCFTCRIRRKKCDEQLDEQGCCGTCVRLRLQCLGFGAELPDYLKDGKQVATYRDKIKTFLASNGMIRGHADSGSRVAEQEANILRLTEDSDTSSAPSPTPSLPSCSDDARQGNIHTLSYVRDQEPEYTVRAKSGCFTCRIRHKKCDEQIDDQGCCGTCVRLRLQCLGFGAKLPDYLKDGKQVATYRDKIKTFLASNGMIRGHANSGSRVAEQEANILRLTEDSDTSSAPSPTPSLSSCSDDARHGSVHTLSHVRDQEPQYTLESVEDEPEYGYPGFKPHAQQLYKTPSQFHGILNDYPMSFPSSSLPLSPAAWPNPSTVPPSQPPTNASSFGSSYYISPNDVDDDAYNSVPNDEYIHIETVSWFPRVPAGDEYVVHYLNHLLPRQFLLADHGTIHYIMYDMLHRTPSARSAVILLAFLYQERLRDFKFNGHGGYPDDTEIFTSLVVNVQNALASSSQQRSEGDAMAGLIVVSCCLFTGGRGRWQEFLGVARQWVGNLLENSGHRIPRAVVADCTESTLFVVKTTLWFDVLASITELQPPALMNTFRDLFDPQGAYVEDPYPVFPGLSMLTPMGCENLVVLGLAETSNLAWWKENEINHRRLSMFELYDRAKDIELRYLGPPQPSPPSYGTPDEDLRHRVSDIFRASARVLLFSILHYDSPHSQEVKLAVEETVSCLKLVPHDEPKMINRALPCVAFSICVAGCLTDDPSHQRYFLDRLRGFKDSAIGNTRSVRDVLETVWKRRRESGERVAWREVMHEMGPEKLLLLV